MSKKTRSPRLTAEQKTGLSASFAKTKNIAASAKDLNINYAQAYTFLSKQKVTRQKAKGATTVSAAVKTLGGAKEIHVKILQMEQDLAALRKQLGAQVKAETAALKKLTKVARL